MDIKRLQELANIQPSKYQVVFRDYYGNDIPFTLDYFISEEEAESNVFV